MSVVLTILSEREANRLTDRIKLAIESIDNGLFKLNSLLVEAQNSNAWQVLGYKSWTAYLADLFDRPLRLPAEKRREVVGYLSGEGLSTRAIAPIVGVSKSQVATDIEVSRTGHVPDLPVPKPPVEHTPAVAAAAPVEEVGDPVSFPPVSPTITPEPVKAPRVEPRPIIGMDGKNYTRPEPKPIPRGDDAAQVNAETESKALGRALITLSGMRYEEHRNRVITEWWPRGNDSVPPDSRALFEPRAIRDIATWLMQLADDLEVAP